jgi:predicted transcriptional regulator
MIDPRKVREMLGLKQWQLGQTVGVDQARISGIEAGYVTPSAKEQAAIERALLDEVNRRQRELSAILAEAGSEV